MAQQIAVVSTSGTKVFRTLQEAIEGADPGSVIYLPGGGFTLPDSVKITKKLTIYGIGHKSNNDNADGRTIISGNIFFNAGSSNSAIIGCYITGSVVIGDGGASVNDILVRYCNLNDVQVRNCTCKEATVNQNYIRGVSSFSNSNAKISNNIACTILDVDGGFILNNIVTTYCNIVGYTGSSYNDRWYMITANNSVISNNITIGLNGYHRYYGDINPINGSNCQLYENMALQDVGESSIVVTDWNIVFVNYNEGAINPNSDFHFKDEYSQYQGKVGIYAGTGFSDDQLAPIPYIVRKIIPEHTDAEGKLNIKIRVKAGE